MGPVSTVLISNRIMQPMQQQAQQRSQRAGVVGRAPRHAARMQQRLSTLTTRVMDVKSAGSAFTDPVSDTPSSRPDTEEQRKPQLRDWAAAPPAAPKMPTSSGRTVSKPIDTPGAADLPFMLYVPDLDGAGLTARRQWQSLAARFDLHTASIPAEDRSTIAELASSLQAELEALVGDASPERPIYLMGEGFGAVVAIFLAASCRQVTRLVLVNPATSYQGSPLSIAGPLLARLPQPLYQVAPFALAPALADPFRVAAASAGSPLPNLDGAGLMQAVQEAVEQLQQITYNLPPSTLQWRLELLAAQSEEAMERLREVEARTMVVVGGADLVLRPTEEHLDAVRERLTRGFVKVLEGSSHALLAEAGVDLVAMMQKEGFYIQRRKFTSEVTSAKQLTAFGYAGPVEIPTREEALRNGDTWTKRIRQLSSPVFFSTLEDGRVVQGLDGIPTDRPLLIVGNHQTYAFDMYVLIEELVAEKGILPRGLAHPGVFADALGNVTTDSKAPLPPVLRNSFKTFGAVPVTPQNFFRLLQRKEMVLLYPGGVREGFKRKNEEYQLFWPARAEFVRMAARFGATILPLASIGIDDGLQILLDSDEIAANAWLGPQALEAAANMPPPRTGVNEVDEFDQSFIPPLIAPKTPERLYFLFQRPVRLEPDVAQDRERCDEIYRDVKGQVEGGLRWLLQRREGDPYRDFVRRMVYENLPGAGPRKAPTFDP